ncbi:hypothetical protein SUGI_1171710 [Cryptomeria japonica]|nr:hypothetical protein SUGI_1171710 [Cryptomeria japonica]
MASRLAVDQQVLDGVILLLILKEGFEWLEKKLSYLCGYLQAANQLRAQDLYVEEWQQEVRDIVEHKADEFIRLCCPRGKGRTGKNIPSNHTGMRSLPSQHSSSSTRMALHYFPLATPEPRLLCKKAIHLVYATDKMDAISFFSGVRRPFVSSNNLSYPSADSSERLRCRFILNSLEQRHTVPYNMVRLIGTVDKT